MDDPAVCLVCGQVTDCLTHGLAPSPTRHRALPDTTLLRTPPSRCAPFQVLQCGTKGSRLAPASAVAPADVGECTLHARTCGHGVGVFYLLTKVRLD